MSAPVLVINTGGTIGMAPGPEGLEPARDFRRHLEALVPTAIRPRLPDFDYREWDPLLDSSNIQPSHWSRLAREIASQIDRYRGIVVLHGTDTMAWTASSLTWQLRGLDRPVILTGAQIPLLEPGSDGLNNWIGALQVAADSGLPEVAIAFGGRLLRGCQSSKIDTTGFAAFDSPRAPWLGEIQGSPRLFREHWQPVSPRAFELPDYHGSPVRLLWWTPGLPGSALEAIATPDCQALVLVLFGSGNGPHQDAGVMASLQRLHARGVALVGLTQCPQGHVADSPYATGQALARAGVRSGQGLTIEAACTGLLHLCALGLRGEALHPALVADSRTKPGSGPCGST